ncbi:MAG: hypothetical protein HYZ26_06490 [Chloroflexi bacterium]|nr:hypothetical protein [Chloroflexota bacterium]
MFEDFPTIRIIPLASLVTHEWHDDQRTPPLIDRLKSSGVLRNPPIVSPFNDGTGRYMVLDGANRTTALERMGYPHVLAQIVEPDAPTLDLKTWNHVCWGISPADFLAGIAGVEGVATLKLETGRTEESFRQLHQRDYLALIQSPDGVLTAALSDNGDLFTRIDKLNDIVNSYKDRCQLDRTRVREVATLESVYEGLAALVVFPHLEMQDVLKLCGAGHLLPPGITRFSVSPRALRVNYPLDDLAAHRPIEEKNENLNRWLQERIARKGVRFYAEPTVLFDE